MTPRLEREDGSPISLSEAQNLDGDLVAQLHYRAACDKLYTDLNRQQHTICSLVRHHLSLDDSATCKVLPQEQWTKGSFNVCIPIQTTSGSVHRNLMLRCCLPYKLAEAHYSGTIDEKLSCEVGAYAWMQQYCQDIRIPFLYGFGFTDHRQYTHENYRPCYMRLVRKIQRRAFSFTHRDIPTYYTRHPSPYHLPTAYMLLEYIGSDVGQMLSNTWSSQLHDSCRRERLFRGIARAMLSLARLPQAQIASFQFHDDCRISLTNRPLTCSMMIFENEGTPRMMQRTETYSCTEAFISDTLSYHDSRLISHPNIIYDKEDCRESMAMRTLLRALPCKYLSKEYRNGPFPLQFTDLHASNIFVDEEWNVTCFIDLEWICARPVEMLAVPYWLTNLKVDEIKGEQLHEFDRVRQEFMRILKAEEEKVLINPSISLSKVMESMWESRRVWFWYCLDSVDAMSYLVRDHICPQFGTSWSPKMEEILSYFWCEDSQKLVDKKMNQLEEYQERLKDLFRT
ncbi:hypothetical protein F4861DRAFT_338105 [Xylaria intraflava]|nr:hypothetical protein F4861DRAFT_338105 [Xylaria intraflava]